MDGGWCRAGGGGGGTIWVMALYLLPFALQLGNVTVGLACTEGDEHSAWGPWQFCCWTVFYYSYFWASLTERGEVHQAADIAQRSRGQTVGKVSRWRIVVSVCLGSRLNSGENWLRDVCRSPPISQSLGTLCTLSLNGSNFVAADMRTWEHSTLSVVVRWIWWRDRVQNSEISVHTRPLYAVFNHMARLPASTPANQALRLQVDSSLMQRHPGRPRGLWADQMLQSGQPLTI